MIIGLSPYIHSILRIRLPTEKAKDVPVFFLKRIVMNPDPRPKNSTVFRCGAGYCPRNDIISLCVVPEPGKRLSHSRKRTVWMRTDLRERKRSGYCTARKQFPINES